MSSSLIQRWVQGFSDSAIQFIDKDTVCLKCGKIIKFINHDGTSSVFQSDAKVGGKLAVHCYNKAFAIAETDLMNPKIFVYDYNFMESISTLHDGALLQITNLQFSSSDYICATSGIPDFKLTVWNYLTGNLMCSVPIDSTPITSLSFSHINWRYICITQDFRLRLWNIEQCENIFKMKEKVFKMPAKDSEVNFSFTCEKDDVPVESKGTTYLAKMQVKVPNTSIVGLHSKEYREFEEFEDTTKRIECVSHTWSPIGDIFVGCRDGQLLKIDVEKSIVKIIINPLNTESGHDLIFQNNMNLIALSKAGIYIGGQDGILRLIQISNTDSSFMKYEEVHKLPTEMSHLNFNAAYTKLGVASTNGILDVLSLTTDKQPCKTVINCGSSDYIDVAILHGDSNLCATIRGSQDFQLWDIKQGNLISTIELPAKAACLVASPICSIVFVGTCEGFLYAIDCTDETQPRLIHSIRLHETALEYMAIEPISNTLITAANDGCSISLSAKASDKFKVYGYTDITGCVQDLSVNYDETENVVQAVIISKTEDSRISGCNKIYYYQLSQDILSAPENFLASRKGDFLPEIIKKMDLNFQTSGFGCALAHVNNKLSMFSVNPSNRYLQYVVLPSEVPKKMEELFIEKKPEVQKPRPSSVFRLSRGTRPSRSGSEIKGSLTPKFDVGNKASYLAYEETSSDEMEHEEQTANLILSRDKSLLFSYCSDGYIRVLDRDKSNVVHAQHIHDTNLGGVRKIAVSADCSKIISCGFDGSLVSTDFNLDANHQRKAREYSHSYNEKISNLATNEASSLNSYEPVNPSRTVCSVVEKSNAQTRARSVLGASMLEEALKYKTWIQKGVFMAQQEEDQQYADTKASIRRQLNEMKAIIQEMVDQNVELPDLEKLERQEFELDVDEQAKIIAETESRVAKVREDIEMENLAKQFIHDVIKKECWDEMKVKGRALKSFISDLEVHNFPMKARTPSELKELEDVATKRRIELSDLKERRECENLSKTNSQEEEEVEEEEVKDSNALTGGTASYYGAQNELLYSQFELHTRDQKMKQIVLLQDTIYRIKEAFNKEFDEVFQKKEQEMARIKEKNSRINKILGDLDQQDQAVPDPEFNSFEKPEKLLTVDDSEVTVEKFLTPEQRKKLEEERLAEEERKRKERADNWRERGLDEMMGGVLEIKKEDELKKDIPKPAFMLTKPEEEWNDDERKAFAEYERKVKELNEEREKYRKQLEAELKKLNGFIDDGKATFEEILQQLFKKKIYVQQSVYQEELKIHRIKWSLLVEEELIQREEELKQIHDAKFKEMVKLNDLLAQAKKGHEKAQEAYDIMCAEDKLLEKNFKKDFADQNAAVVDVLFRAYRRRPKRNLAATGNTGLQAENSPYNPYSDRPSTAKQQKLQRAALVHNLEELDADRKEEIDPDVWNRLCKVRKKKIFKEYDIKQKALEVAEMNAFVQRRLEDETVLKEELNYIESLQEILQEDRLRFYSNLEIQLLMKQGQVEVDVHDNFIHEFTDSILIHRSMVEELNQKICDLGEAKVKHMIEEKDLKKKFIHIEWELKRMMMEYQDLENKMKDIRQFRISREVQRYLNAQDYDGMINAEIHTLEQAIMKLQQHQEHIIETKSNRLKVVQNVRCKKMKDKNGQLVEDLSEMNVCVNERRHISEVQGQGIGNTTEKRYKQILQRQKLVDLAKAQAKEVAVLRAEVERLRMRTFPALVQNK